MTKTSRYQLLASCVALMLGVLVLADSAVAQRTALFKLKQKFKNSEIFHASFRHIFVDSFTQDSMSSRGEIWVTSDKYKVQTQNQTMVVDGDRSAVYDKKKSRVIVSKYVPEDDDFAPSRILYGIDSTYTVKQEKQGGGSIYLTLTSDDTFAVFKLVEIMLSDDLIPQKITAVDPTDNLMITHFSEGRFTEIKAGMFSLNYPPGTEIVDLRN